MAAMPQRTVTTGALSRLLVLLAALAGALTAAPRLSISFPFQLYRSGENTPALYNLSERLGPGKVDLYAVLTYAGPDGARVLRYANSDGQLGARPVRYRKAAQLAVGQTPLGYLRQPVITAGISRRVSWWLYALPAGTEAQAVADLGRNSLNQMSPANTAVASRSWSNPWEQFALLQSTSLIGGMRLRTEVSADGRRFRCVVGPSIPQRFWQLPGPKLILVAGLGCGARAWAGNAGMLVLQGRTDPRRRGILCYPELLKHYRHVAIFEYPSAGALDGPEIAGRLLAALRHARPADRIDMIGHSMGGVVVRHFIEAGGGHQVIDNAIFLQTPLNGLSNGVYSGLAGLLPSRMLDNALGAVSPLNKMLRGSAYYKRLNAPWIQGAPPTSATGFGTCRYYCVAGGVHGSGRDPRRAAGWFDYQSDAFPTEIKAASALWLPLGGGAFGELDPTGRHELLLTSAAEDQDRYIGHVSFIFYMADDTRNGTARWLRERLWPAAKRQP